MTTPSYWWVVGTGQVGYSRIWDGVSPDPTIARTPRKRPYRRVLNPYSLDIPSNLASCYELISNTNDD
jgi:hypothetical protein